MLHFRIYHSLILGAFDGRADRWKDCVFYNSDTDCLECTTDRRGVALLWLTDCKRVKNDIRRISDGVSVGYVKNRK